MFGQKPFGRDQQQGNKPSQNDTEAASPHQVRFQQSSLAAQQPSFGNTAGEFRAFGSPATFVTPSTIAPYTGSHSIEIPSTFGSRPQPGTNAPVFGSAFQSPSMAAIGGSPVAATQQQQQQQPDSPPVSYSFTAAASRLAATSTQQPPSWSSGFGRPGGFGQTSAPIFPAGSVAATSSSTNVFGAPAADRSSRRDQNQPDAGVVTAGQTGSAKREEAATERADVRSGRAVLQQEQIGKPTIQRKGALFARAMAGVGRHDRARVRLPSRDDTHRDSRPRHPSGSGRSHAAVQPSEVTRVSPEEIVHLKSIVCKGIPGELNDKQVLQEHFGRFGVVTRVYCNPQKASAIVHFLDHASAVLAKMSGTVIRPGTEPVLILWSKSVSSARPKPTSPSADIRQESPRSSKKYLDQSEINEELQSMGQGQSLEGPKILARPKELAQSRDAPKIDLPKKAKKKQRDVSKRAAGEKVSTEELLKMSAHTAEERYRLLDARDKFWRQGVKKQSNLAMAKATVGTCPDMCPEKERYMRAHRNQLHPYETGDDGRVVDHARVIKEYSRSSADQEEPLPHELRGAGVLSMTIDYLMCNVMDRHEMGQSSTEEWYDFVWNRTRAIRKDITQQHLCDAVAVSAVEKCARFHVHCAERLCEEDICTFDQKINNENLTNCLQTLKHLYEDLEAVGQRCAGEAEFRAYDVLLNLNEGDILRQAQLLHPSVRQSPSVVQALDFYVALNANNYVRFFKLVRATSYLNACIIQRYFTQARLKALLAILRAYSPPNHSGTFPVSKLVDILAFEDEVDAREFVEHHCLAIENGHVVLDRSMFCQPENAPPLKRATKIIESKRMCSIGEVIGGGPLPPNPLQYHVPHSSFNEYGFLRDETAESANATSTAKQDVTSVLQAPVTSGRSSSLPARVAVTEDRQSAQCIDELADSVTNDLIHETVQSLAHATSANELGTLKLLRRWTLETATAVLEDVCNASIRELAALVFGEEKMEELKARRRREEAELERQRHVALIKEECVSEATDQVLECVVELEVRQLVAEQLRLEKEAARRLHIQQAARQLTEDYCRTWVDVAVRHACAVVHAEQTESRKQILSRVSRKLDVWRSAAAFRKWQKYTAKRKHMRHSMELFPSCSLGLRSKGTMGQQWVGAKSTGLVSPIQVAHNRKCIDKNLDMNLLSCSIRDSFGSLYIDLPSLASDFVPYARHLVPGGVPSLPLPPQNLYWKVLLSLGEPSSPDETRRFDALVHWLRLKLNQPLSRWSRGSSKTEIFQMTVEDNGTGQLLPATAISFRALLGDRHPNDRQSLGTQGIFHVLHNFENSNDSGREHEWVRERARLSSILRSKPDYPPVPLLVAVRISPSHTYFGSLADRIAETLGLQGLVDSGCVSEFLVSTFRTDLLEPSSTEYLLQCLQWLAQRCPDPPKLRIQSFGHFLSDTTSRHFSAFVYHDLLLHPELCGSHQLPDVLISAYNHSLDHAAATVSDKALKNISWPPTEFADKYPDLPSGGWNTDETLRQLRLLVASFRLPSFPVDVKKCVEWQDAVEAVWSYMDHTDGSEDWASKIVLASRIQKILDKSYERYRAAGCELAPHEIICWTDLIQAFIDYNLQMAPIGLCVAYDPDTAELFSLSQEWEQSTIRTAAMHGGQGRRPQSPKFPVSKPGAAKTAKRKQEFVSDNVRNIPKRRTDPDPFQRPPEQEQLNRSCSELMRQLRIEKERAAEFEQLLRRELQEETSIQHTHSGRSLLLKK